MNNSPSINAKPLLLALLAGLPLFLGAQSSHRQMQEGDRLYDQRSWSAAEATYRKAGASAAAAYNSGNAAYQQGKLEAAADQFKKATAGAPSAAARSDAFFNLGNAYLFQGKYREAIAAYENSLRRQPNRYDAKKNLQIAKRKYQEQQDPPPPSPQAPPPPPPPPSVKPQRNYLDQAVNPQKREQPSGNLTAAAAKQILETTVSADEQRSAKQYRELSPATRPSRVKKDW